MRIYLVRHPTPAVAAGTCYGQTDLALIEDAALSAALVRNLLPPDAPIYSSPLRRCRELADVLHPAPTFDDRLRELDFGTWEMQPWADIDRKLIDAWADVPLEFAPPGGESLVALRSRVKAFLREMLSLHTENLVLVSHAGVMKVCAAELLGLQEAAWIALQFDYGSVSMIEEGKLLWHNKRDEQPPSL